MKTYKKFLEFSSLGKVRPDLTEPPLACHSCGDLPSPKTGNWGQRAPLRNDNVYMKLTSLSLS